MTKEDFKLLSVGDVVYLTEGSRYEIVTRRPGFCNFDMMLSCKSLIDNSDMYFLYNHNQFYMYNQFYMTSNIDLKNWIIFDINNLKQFWTNNQEQNSIKHYEKKIEETKSELNRLSTILNGLQESKRMKELTETLSNLIIGDFYTVKDDVGNVFTGKYKGTNVNQSHTFDLLTQSHTFDLLTIERTLSPKRIKQIIHRPNFSNEYKILLKKLDTFNKDLENT